MAAAEEEGERSSQQAGQKTADACSRQAPKAAGVFLLSRTETGLCNPPQATPRQETLLLPPRGAFSSAAA